MSIKTDLYLGDSKEKLLEEVSLEDDGIVVIDTEATSELLTIKEAKATKRIHK